MKKMAKMETTKWKRIKIQPKSKVNLRENKLIEKWANKAIRVLNHNKKY